MTAVDDLPLQHVQREQPPWRRGHIITECGLPVAAHPVITRAEFMAKVKTQGRQRAAFTTCMTCWDSARRNRAWEDSPVESLIREAERHRWPGRNNQNDVDGFRNELLAIAMLIEAHQEEFDALSAGLGETADLGKARAAKRSARTWRAQQ